MVVFDFDQGGVAHDLEEDGDAFAGDALHDAFEAAEGAVFEEHGLAGFELADFEQAGVVAQVFDLANALEQFVVERGGLEAKAHQVMDALGAAHDRDALVLALGPEKDVPGKHGLEHFHRTVGGFFVLLVQRQVDLKRLFFKLKRATFSRRGLVLAKYQREGVGW